MAQAPGASLPKQCGDWPDLKAAYRFLHHPEVTPQRIQQVHCQQVREQCLKHPVVLAIQDTSELDYTTQTTAVGYGPIGNGSRQGLLQHSTLAVVPAGQLLGILHQIWTPRIPKPKRESRRERYSRPKESDLWPQSVRAVGILGPPTQLVHVEDRGGDFYESMFACHETQVGFLIRAKSDRCVNGGTDKLWSWVASQVVAGHRDVAVPARPAKEGKPAQPARVARLAIQFTPLTIDPPKGDPRFEETLKVWAVQAAEVGAPAGVEPLEWMLLTSVPVESFEQACERVDWYCLRWTIEEWHKAIKSGCRLEDSQLKDAGALACLAALLSVVAVRLLQLRDVAQSAATEKLDDPCLPANQPQILEELVPPIWRRVVATFARCPADQLTPRMFWQTIAKRGGWLGRKHDGPPGWLTIWRGWADFVLIVMGAELRHSANPPETYG